MPNILVVLIASAWTLIVTWVAAYATHHYHLRAEKKLRDREARIRVVAALMGNKLLLAQLYTTGCAAVIHSDHHEQRWRLAGCPEEGHDFRETQRWMHKSEELFLEIARAHRDVFEAVASARILFPSCAELLRLTKAVYKHPVPRRAVWPEPNTAPAELQEWDNEAVRQLNRQVWEMIEEPIEDLVEYLGSLVENTTAAGTSRWREKVRRFWKAISRPTAADTDPPATGDKP